MWFMMYRPAEVKTLGADVPPTEELFGAAGVRRLAGGVKVVDGPFTETKELFGGEPPQDPE